MSIPSQTDMFGVVLGLMQDGKERSRKAVNTDVAEMLSLTDEERDEQTSSGKRVYESRAGWSVSYLNRAQLLDRVSRGVYRVNDAGRELHAKGLGGSELFQTLRQIIDEKNPWNLGAGSAAKTPAKKDAEPDVSSEKSPQEQIGDLVEEMNDVLGQELLDLIMDHDPAFFEKLVVNLVETMGYGKGKVTSYSGDGGIDGLVTTDELGFRPIYTQAKRYAAEHKVSRPQLQSFVGALNGARNGVFITTSSFTAEALDYASNYPNATLALIDGKRLTDLMIKYGLGVATESVVEIKRVDSDYFEEA